MRVLVTLLCLSLIAALAGCGNVESGAGAGKPTPVPGDDDDDDDGGSGATPTPTAPGDPGQVPEAMGGWFNIGNMHSPGDDPTAGIGGSGLFPTMAIPLFWKEPWEALFGGYPDLPMDTCDWGYGASIAFQNDQQVSLPAGTLTLTSEDTGAGDFLFLPLGGLQLYIAQGMGGVFTPAGDTYTLSATGDPAGVGPFSTTFVGPPDVRVTSPSDLNSFYDPYPIDRTQDFPLTWSSAPDGLPLYVFILQAPEEGATPQVVVCKFTDDGAAVIPASAFQMFEEAPWGATQQLQVMKYRIHTFLAPGATGPTILNFASGYNRDVTF